MGCTTSKSSKNKSNNQGITVEQQDAQTLSTQQNQQNENYTLKNRFQGEKPQQINNNNNNFQLNKQQQREQQQKNIIYFLSNLNAFNVSGLKSDISEDKQNSIQTQALQYIEMITINNFIMEDPDKLIEIYQAKNIEKIPLSDQFKKFKLYQFIKQNKHLLNNLKQPKENAQLLIQTESKIKAANYDLKQCAKDIALYILMKNSIADDDNYGNNEDDHGNKNPQLQKSQVDLDCTVKSKIEADEDEDDGRKKKKNQFQNDEIEKTLNHLVYTGQKYFYYSLPIKVDHKFNQQKAEKEKEQFGQHVKEKLTNEVYKGIKGIVPDDFLILEVIYNPLTVNYKTNHESPNVNKVYIGQSIKINENYLDPKWNMSWKGGEDKRGQINGQPKEYYLPSKLYYGLGLNIVENYPKDGWFGSGHDDKTWIVLYHKQADFSMDHFKSQNNSTNSSQQKYSNDDCRFGRGKVGHGVYLVDKIENCENHGNNSYIKIGDKKYEFIYQCRANPKTIKSPKSQPNIFVANNPKDIRPYRLLIREVK